MKKSLTDLFNEIGSEHLEYQILAQVLTDVGQTEDGAYTTLTFATDQLSLAELQTGNVNKVGFIVWADREETERALDSLGLTKPAEPVEDAE